MPLAELILSSYKYETDSKNYNADGPWKTYDAPLRHKIVKMNPGYKYEYYNDADCVSFMKRYFGTHVVNAFNILKPGAFKADLFRYCYIYIKGGIYLDIDLELLFRLTILSHAKPTLSLVVKTSYHTLNCEAYGRPSWLAEKISRFFVMQSLKL